MKILKLLVILIVIGLLGGYGFIQSGIFNVAATIDDGPVLSWLLHETMENSVKKRARDIDVPDLSSHEMILAGVSDYVGMCAQCHGEPGQPQSIIAQGLNPAPPDLGELAETGSAAEMFWIVSNGIRMTGMPAFSKTHAADGIWPVVAFLQSADELTIADYNKLKEDAKGSGHHALDEDNGEHDSLNQPVVSSSEEAEHDHSSHDHSESQSKMEENDHSSDDIIAASNNKVEEHDHSSHNHSAATSDAGDHDHDSQVQAEISSDDPLPIVEATNHDEHTHEH